MDPLARARKVTAMTDDETKKATGAKMMIWIRNAAEHTIRTSYK